MAETQSQVAGSFGGFRKRVYSLGSFLSDVVSLAPKLPRAGAIWMGGRVDPKFREELMVAVARVNGCRYCVFAHETWAMHDGATREELAELAHNHGESFEPARWAAIQYGKALTFSRESAAALRARLGEHYSESEIADIDTVVRVMTLANLCGNTVDAFFSRLGGNPAADSRPLDELILVSVTFAVGVWVTIPLCIWRRESPVKMLREFLDFSKEFETELGASL